MNALEIAFACYLKPQELKSVQQALLRTLLFQLCAECPGTRLCIHVLSPRLKTCFTLQGTARGDCSTGRPEMRQMMVAADSFDSGESYSVSHYGAPGWFAYGPGARIWIALSVPQGQTLRQSTF